AALALRIGCAQEGRDDREVAVGGLGRRPPEIGKTQVDIELQQVDPARAVRHGKSVGKGSDGTRGETQASARLQGQAHKCLSLQAFRTELVPGQAQLHRRYAAWPWASFVLDRL